MAKRLGVLLENLKLMARETDIAKMTESKYTRVLKPIAPRKPLKSPLIIGFDSEWNPVTGQLISIQFAIAKKGEMFSKVYYCNELSARSLLEHVLKFLGEAQVETAGLKRVRIYLIAHFSQSEIGKITDYLKEFKLRVYNKAMSAEMSLGALEDQEYDYEVHQKPAFTAGKYSLKILDLYGYFPRELKAVGELVSLPKIELDRSQIHIIRERDPELFERYAERDAEICVLAFNQLRELFLKEFEIDILYYPTTAGLTGAIFRQSFLKEPIAPTREVVISHKRKTAGGIWIEEYGLEPVYDGSRDVRYWAMRCYWGGRTESYGRGFIRGDFEYYDMVSIYPSASMLQALPNKDTEWVHFNGLKKALPLEGFCRVRFEFPSDCKYPCLPVMPVYVNKLFFPLKGESYCTLSEVKTALKLGAEIHEIEGWGFKPTGSEKRHSLAEFMSHFMKLKGGAKKGTLQYEMWKLIMNSLVGKLCQKTKEYDVSDMVAFIQKTGVEDLSDPKLRKYLYKPPSVGSCWAPEWATLILGRARALMGELIAKGSLFCSTDSGLFPKGIDLNCEALNQLKSVGSDFIKEFECDSALLFRARLYALFKDGKIVKCARHGTIAPEQQFKEIIKENLEAGRDLERPAVKVHLVDLKEALKKGEPLGKEIIWERPIGWGWDGKRKLVEPEANIWREFSETMPLEELPEVPPKPSAKPRKPMRPEPKMGRPKVLSPEQIEEIERLHKEGWTIRKIAKHFGVGVATISRCLKKGS